MVNYKRVVCEVAVFLAVVAVTSAAPAPDCVERHYDQRQNGTDNIRVNIDGVVIAVAPAETLLEAASDIADLIEVPDLEDLLKPGSSTKPESDNSILTPEPEKPVEKPAEKPVEKPAESSLSDVSLKTETKSQKKDASVGKQEKLNRLKHRLASFLVPLLRKTRHH